MHRNKLIGKGPSINQHLLVLKPPAAKPGVVSKTSLKGKCQMPITVKSCILKVYVPDRFQLLMGPKLLLHLLNNVKSIYSGRR